MKLHRPCLTISAHGVVGQAEFDLPGNSGKSVTRRFKSRVVLTTAVSTAMEAGTPPDTRLLRIAEVVELTSLSSSRDAASTVGVGQ